MLFGLHDNVVGMAVAWGMDVNFDVMEGGNMVFGSCRSWWCLMIVMIEDVKCA